MENLLEPFPDPVTVSRNGTELSRFCERLLGTFISYKSSQARVRHHETNYSLDILYQGLRNACRKNDFKNLVEVHKRDDELILIRKVRR